VIVSQQWIKDEYRQRRRKRSKKVTPKPVELTYLTGSDTEEPVLREVTEVDDSSSEELFLIREPYQGDDGEGGWVLPIGVMVPPAICECQIFFKGPGYCRKCRRVTFPCQTQVLVDKLSELQKDYWIRKCDRQ
jgi:hypothetical protein